MSRGDGKREGPGRRKARASKASDAAAEDTHRGGRIWIEDRAGRRPFMRGIIVHSLMARGLGFEDAYQVADKVRKQLRGREKVKKHEVAKLVHDELGRGKAPEDLPPVPPLPSILVGPAGREAPFSKGQLSQSLLAASLDPNDAFDTAREIELELLRLRTRKISRTRLRKLAYERLLQRFGAQAAERYLVWREYQEPDKPVIILLGGTAGAGKTSLSIEVAHRLGISRVLSTDSIRQIMRVMLSKELAPAIHGSSFEAHENLPPLAEGEDALISGFRSQAAVVAVGARAILDRAIAENTSLVLDGVALVPGLIDLSRYRKAAHVIYLVVATLDEKAFRDRFTARGRRSGRAPHRYLENLPDILRIQDHYLELADRYSVPIVDNASFDGSVLLVIRHVVESLRGEREAGSSSASRPR